MKENSNLTEAKPIGKKHCTDLTQIFQNFFPKIVNMLLERQVCFKMLNKKSNMFSSKPKVRTGIAKSEKVKFSRETN